MKHFALAAIALLIVTGCAEKEAEEHESRNEPNPTEGLKPALELGQQQSGQKFEVKLTTQPAEPKVGAVTFVVDVLKKGKPEAVKSVHIDTEMPQMQMGGPSADLAEKSNAVYEGSAKLEMGGKYDAKVKVVGLDGGTETFTYGFEVSQ